MGSYEELYPALTFNPFHSRLITNFFYKTLPPHTVDTHCTAFMDSGTISGANLAAG